jgi:hypothetical protein
MCHVFTASRSIRPPVICHVYAHTHTHIHTRTYTYIYTHTQIEVEKINKERLQEAFDLSFAIEFSQICEEETTHLISKAKKQGQQDGGGDDNDNQEANNGPSLMDIQSLVMKAKKTKDGSREPKGDSREMHAGSVDEASVVNSKGDETNDGTYSGGAYSDVDEEEREESDEKPQVADVAQEIDMTKPFMPVCMVNSASEAVRCVCLCMYVCLYVCLYVNMYV